MEEAVRRGGGGGGGGGSQVGAINTEIKGATVLEE